jgi:hypothetical protein
VGIFDLGVHKPLLFHGTFTLDAWALIFVASVLSWPMITGRAPHTRPETASESLHI